MQWGEYEAFLRKLARQGKRVRALERRVELYFDLVPVWQAFNELHSARHIGMAACPLTITDIYSWLKLNEYAGEEAKDMVYLIQALDRAWFKARSEARDKDKDDAKPSAGDRRFQGKAGR